MISEQCTLNLVIVLSGQQSSDCTPGQMRDSPRRKWKFPLFVLIDRQTDQREVHHMLRTETGKDLN